MENHLANFIFFLNVILILFALMGCGKKNGKTGKSQRPAQSKEVALKSQPAPPPKPAPAPPKPATPAPSPAPTKPAAPPSPKIGVSDTGGTYDPNKDAGGIQPTVMTSLKTKKKVEGGVAAINEDEDGGIAI